MRKFEGRINGKIYTNYEEFNKALTEIKDTDNMSVSYEFVSVPDKAEDLDCENKYVSENQYVKSISNKKDVELDDTLVEKLKSASNKSDIKLVACRKIANFDSMIEDNLLHINELKTDCKKLEDTIKLYSSQIKNLTDANNNYYLNKEYYTNIKNLIDTPAVNTETKGECKCGCKCEECDCDDGTTLSFDEIYGISDRY